MKKILTVILLAGICIGAAAHTFEISYEKNAFLIDGKETQIRCGELHLARIPRAYWRHRIRMCKAMGLNAVCAYLFWNYHEPERGRYEFTGEKDVAEFCRIAQEEGMWVILRPGPYVCAEWEFGGLPWWLLDKGADKVKLRTRDPAYLEPAKAWLRRVAGELRDLQVTRGGPILMVQDENEYGFFGDDGEYIRELYTTLRETGFDVPVFTCNPAYNLPKGDIPEVFKVVNFGSNPQNGFEKLREVLPQGPLMCGEYYPAWFDSWGQPHHVKPAQAMLDDIDWMLAHGGSFSLYMAHGGTSFGWWAGCNSPFAPQTSSYDYDAPVSEQGRATPKFYALRELLKKHMTAEELAALPEVPAPMPVQAFKVDSNAEYVRNTAVRTHRKTKDPLPFEMLTQGYGAVLYIAEIPDAKGGLLKSPNLRDHALVIDKNNNVYGWLDRRFPARGVAIPAGVKEVGLAVVHSSRYNFGTAMNHSEKGLLPPVTLDGVEIKGWATLGISPDTGFRPSKKKTLFKRWKFDAPSLADTWLLVRGWKKGHVWLNGHPLGRFWGIGPTQTMFTPGCWLKEKDNELVVFDFGMNVPMDGLEFVSAPVLDELHPECDLITAPKRENAPLNLDALRPVSQGVFPNSAAAQTVKFAPVSARQIAFVADDAWSKDPSIAAIAEFELLDAAGRSIPHDKWRFINVSSEESLREDGSAENAIDGQISNFWHSRWSTDKAKAPHILAIDLGNDESVAGFIYTPRQSHVNGRIRRYRLYAAPKLVR